MSTPARTAAILPAEQVLNSWKEIAAYLDRGVRTVQRWEAELGLPVRRPRGKSRSAVVAMRTEIDEWLRACPVSTCEQPAKPAPVELKSPLTPGFEGISSTRELVARSHALGETLAHSRQEFDRALGRLVRNIARMSDNPVLL